MNSLKRSGFTLVELMVVIAILAVLMAVLFPLATSALARSRNASCQHHIRQAGGALLAESAGETRLRVYDFSIGTLDGGYFTLACGCKIPLPDLNIPTSLAVLDGCPEAPKNPVYALDPDNQPRRLAYGILAYNQGVPKSSAWPWYLACSEFPSIRKPADVALRHQGKANLFHMDGHVMATTRQELEFPEDMP